jgi:ADP-heptose:LPS heptosyltransferase
MRSRIASLISEYQVQGTYCQRIGPNHSHSLIHSGYKQLKSQPVMNGLILKNYQAPGDIVMLTAALRDLHLSHPGRYTTAVETHYPELFQHNPYVVCRSKLPTDCLTLDCEYRSFMTFANSIPVHFLHGFIHDINVKLKLNIRLTKFAGDIHLSPAETEHRPSFPAVPELPHHYWVLIAGGKPDITVKWWSARRYQEVVDHFRGRISFAQVGREDHGHPPIKGAIDLRGRTTLRQLIHLIHHSQGVLCPVTLAMHLAAAVPSADGRIGGRPCVVVAGGREPPHWVAYPHHQFIHTVGALWCCTRGGCWKSRTRPLNDGHDLDMSRHLCVDVRGELPACMDLIGSDQVISRIEQYYRGGLLVEAPVSR